MHTLIRKMDKNKSIMMFFGRLFLALLFIMAGIGKITGFDSTIGFMQAFGITSATMFFLVVGIIFELGGGLLLLFGYKTKFGALLLIVFLVITSLVFHTNFADQVEFTNFLKNLALIGGLLYVMAQGPGRISFDYKNNN